MKTLINSLDIIQLIVVLVLGVSFVLIPVTGTAAMTVFAIAGISLLGLTIVGIVSN